jgi:hypothetical protein
MKLDSRKCCPPCVAFGHEVRVRPRKKKYARQDSNLQPSVPKTDALSNCATGARQAANSKD